MRIVLVSPYDLDRPGGVQNHVRELANTLQNRDHALLVLGPGVTGGLGKSVTVRANGSRAPIGISFAGVAALRQQLDRFNPDLVHVHEPGVPRIGWTAARYPPAVAHVATCHAYAKSARYAPLLKPIGQRITGRIDRFIAVSDAAKQFHARALGVAEQQFAVIGNGIHLPNFVGATPRAPSDVSERPRLVYVGRLERRKGVDVLLEAFKQCINLYPNAELTLVGDGPERARLEQFVATNHLTQVTFTGRVLNAERTRLLHWADLAIAPARGGESFGIVLLEALASGCALIASDIAGYRDVAVDGRDAWLVTPANATLLAATIVRVLGDATERNIRLAQGLKRAQQFAWPNITDAIETVYRDAVVRRW